MSGPKVESNEFGRKQTEKALNNLTKFSTFSSIQDLLVIVEELFFLSLPTGKSFMVRINCGKPAV